MTEMIGLVEIQRQAEKAVDVLRSAIEHLHPPRNGETLEDLALRLRGSAVLAHSAGLELAAASGFHAAAHEASEAGMLDERGENDG